MEIKKTISQIALGLAVIGLGAGASAFTNKVETKRQANGFLTNNGLSYNLRNDYDPNNCSTDPNQACAFEITSPTNIPDKPEHSQAEVQNYLSQGWVEARNMGLYED